MVTSTTGNSAKAWAPNVVSTFNPDDVVPTALIRTCAVEAGRVDGDAPSLLVPYIRTDPAADFADEGAEITQTQAEFDQVEVSTYKVSVLTQVSAELTMQAGASTRLAQSMQRSVTAKADAAFLANATAPTGLLNLTGTSTGGDIGGTGGDNLDALYDGIATIEADGGTATQLIVNPTDWATLAKLKEATGSNRSLLGDAHAAPERTLAGIPVIAHASMTAGSALLIDRSEIVAAVGEVRLARSEHAAFSSDSVMVRATWRIGWDAVRPERLVSLTIGAA